MSTPIDRTRAVAANETSRQFVRFLIVGVLNTGVGWAVYALLVLAGIAPQPALAIAFVVGVMWNYLTHARLVFGNRGLSKLPLYGLAYLAVWAFNAASLALLLAIGLGPLLAQAILAPVAAVVSFILIARVLTGRYPFFGGR